MSGARSNIVPMPMSMPASAPAMWSGFPAGCCPPGGMDALLQCYCDIQAATAFISKVVQDLAANDPAFQQSLVDAIVASGSNVPLIGVTNGANAQPGQIGEFIDITQDVNLTAGNNTPTITLGTLPPGDWDCWAALYISIGFNTASFFMPSLPAGFSNNLVAYEVSDGGAVSNYQVLLSQEVRALTSVPSLVAFSLGINVSGTGVCQMLFNARRRR